MPIEVFSGNGMRASLSELAPLFERDTGLSYRVRYDPGKVLLRRIAQGESADVLLAGDETVEELVGRGVVTAASRRPLVRNGIGLAVRKGLPQPDISNRAALVAALRAAASVAYTSEGASGIYFAGLIDRLGIGAEVRAKARTQQGGLVGELLVAGKADLAIQQMPELLAVPGIDVVGPLPDEVQKIGTTEAAIFAASPNAADAARFIAFLASATARPVLRARGFVPVGG
jgi:molybdate transport system substrate-binding protein